MYIQANAHAHTHTFVFTCTYIIFLHSADAGVYSRSIPICVGRATPEVSLSVKGEPRMGDAFAVTSLLNKAYFY